MDEKDEEETRPESGSPGESDPEKEREGLLSPVAFLPRISLATWLPDPGLIQRSLYGKER
ncbi:MAG: hypothetical protein E6G97_17935 [Alphaproteobacteria bacterium]|nr:MAG: hypothetical protein E6G97_17935 [Alphaproteobacteria bacterium]